MTSSKTDLSEAELVFKAKLAEQAERYEEMLDLMRKLVERKQSDLQSEERGLLSVAFKNLVGKKRTAWRTVYKLESREKAKNEQQLKNKDAKEEDTRRLEQQLAVCKDYRVSLEKELCASCNDVVSLVQGTILPKANAELARTLPGLITNAQSYKDKQIDNLEKELQTQLSEYESKSQYLTKITNAEALVFYFKMLGDYNRYVAEAMIDSEQDRIQASCRALGAYFFANEIARVHLAPSHPMRLGLSLNFSVFYYEILNKPDRACNLAKNAFDDAIGEMDQIPHESYRDSTLIMQLLRDNLTLWTSEQS